MKAEQLRRVGKVAVAVLTVVMVFVLLEFTRKGEVALWPEQMGGCFGWLPEGVQTWLMGRLTWSGLLVLAAICAAALMFANNLWRWVMCAKYGDQKSQNLMLLGSLMLLLWATGWGLYLQALLLFPPQHHFVNAELLLRSAIASLDLFMLDIDSNILDVIKGHEHLKGAIAYVSLLSFACTVVLLVSLVYARLAAYLRLRFFTRVSARRPHLYVFWGLNTQTEQLARSVGNDDANGVRVFVEQSKDSDEDTEGWNRLVNMLTHRREAFRKVKELGARLSVVGGQLTAVANEHKDVLGELSLDSLRRQIATLGAVAEQDGVAAELHLFFLSDSVDVNIQSAAVIGRDETIVRASQKGVKVVIYCHARRSSVSRVIEDSGLDSTIQVKVIDSAHLSVELLKMRNMQQFYPVNFVKVEPDATVSTPFNSLVIGFGDTGQDAVRYLYEYGAFVSNDRSKGVRRSAFCCHVVDSKMDVIAPQYMEAHLRPSEGEAAEDTPLVSFGSGKDAYVNLHGYDYNTEEFQKLLADNIGKLQYVFIAVGDDVEGIKLAVRILKRALRERIDIRTFRILVRSYSSVFYPHMQKIADHYNGLAYAELIAQMQHGTVQPDCGGNPEKTIVLFGRTEDIYSYDTIVSDKIYRESVQYYNSYNRVRVLADSDFARLTEEEKGAGRVCSESRQDYAWLLRRDDEMKFRVEGSTNYASVMAVRRKEAQDMENAMHRHTKHCVALRALAGQESALQALEKGIRFGKLKRVLVPSEEAGVPNRYVYVDAKNVQQVALTTLMNTLAQMEHLRWNASHQMLGYVYGTKKDETLQHHNCLTSWEKLASDEIRGYDFDVVERSLILADEEREKKCTTPNQ